MIFFIQMYGDFFVRFLWLLFRHLIFSFIINFVEHKFRSFTMQQNILNYIFSVSLCLWWNCWFFEKFVYATINDKLFFEELCAMFWLYSAESFYYVLFVCSFMFIMKVLHQNVKKNNKLSLMFSSFFLFCVSNVCLCIDLLIWYKSLLRIFCDKKMNVFEVNFVKNHFYINFWNLLYF